MKKLARGVVLIGQGIWTGAMLLFALFGVFLVGALVVGLVSNAVNGTLGHEEDKEQHASKGYESTGYGSGTGYHSTGYPREGQGYNPAPYKENGERSYEFEPEDFERAEEASPELREYCEGAVSEAQELGCLSHAEAP